MTVIRDGDDIIQVPKVHGVEDRSRRLLVKRQSIGPISASRLIEARTDGGDAEPPYRGGYDRPLTICLRRRDELNTIGEKAWRKKANARSSGGGTRRRTNRDWWPNQLNFSVLHQQLRPVRPDGQGVRLRRGVQEPRPRRGDQGPARPDDRLAGLVAGRLRPLRRPVHPHGVAQRRHLSHRRRPRRRRRRPAALRAAQQLAGQRQPRQGAPPAVADQAEIRPQDLLGRPA